MATESFVQPGALAYSRSVYSSMIDWYKLADTKAQLLLTLNGIYPTVLSSIAIASSTPETREPGRFAQQRVSGHFVGGGP